ncbi:MAG: cytochrome c oxidase accessory protein CcoG [Sedimenticola sp.]|nr:cytochrome c oxidase accessory protein CcoG [Sedimenticola sp.]
MNDNPQSKHDAVVDELYAEAIHWKINTGEEKIHAKRIPGSWRLLKWLASLIWVPFFLVPYLRWDDRQAILFDIPSRQFHLLGVTILPQDFWMLSLLLLFFAILLAVITALAGRVWCGFFCFQTVWTDVFTWVEEKLEGSPQKRKKLDQGGLNFTKIRIKATKHLIWILVSALTGISFVAWFVDVYQLWADIFSFNLGVTAMVTILLFIGGTYGLAGFLREQTCFWLCPYARIQGVMVDNSTAVPTYDFHRGEPRGRVKKGVKEEARTTGDCVDCNQCVAVCPTGVDIRHGQQEGCITCALCIDACDAVMEKLDRPKGLIRYESLDVLNGKEDRPLLKRPRVWVYSLVLLFSLAGIGYGMASLDAIELKVIHSRQPLYVMQSDGSVQNKYTVKVLNKMTENLEVNITAAGIDGIVVVGADEPVSARKGMVTPRTLFVRIPRSKINKESQPLTFYAETTDNNGNKLRSERISVFIGPK